MATDDTAHSAIETAATALADAHRSLQPFPLAQMPALQSYADAVAVQARTMALLGDRLGGWKISMTAEGAAVPGIMYAGQMHERRARHTLTAGRPIGYEAEIAVRLGADLPPRPGRPYSREEVEAAVDSALAGVEIVDSRYGRSAKPPFLAALADRINNAGFIAGPDVKSWRALDLRRLRCVVTKDGKAVHDKIGGHPQDDPLFPLAAYASAQIDPLGGLKRGQIVTLGSLIGLDWYDSPCTLALSIEGLGEVTFDIVSA